MYVQYIRTLLRVSVYIAFLSNRPADISRGSNELSVQRHVMLQTLLTKGTYDVGWVKDIFLRQGDRDST